MVDEATRVIKELDVVVITQDVPEHGLISGDVGTVVHCYKDDEAYEVEVVGGKWSYCGSPDSALKLSATEARMGNFACS